MKPEDIAFALEGADRFDLRAKAERSLAASALIIVADCRQRQMIELHEAEARHYQRIADSIRAIVAGRNAGGGMTRHPVALCREEALRRAISLTISQITCARGLLPPGAALNHLDEAYVVLCLAIAAGTQSAETSETSAQCEASQSGGCETAASPITPLGTS